MMPITYGTHRICPSCNANEAGVVDSRPTTEGMIRRRIVCKACGHKWTTMELPADVFWQLKDAIANTEESRHAWLIRGIRALLAEHDKSDAHNEQEAAEQTHSSSQS